MGELKPCPFCGGAAKLVEVEPSGYVVECTNGICNASTNIRYSCGDDAVPLVVEQWNRRTTGQAVTDATLSDSQCDAIARALDKYGREKLGCEGGLPTWDDECFIVMRHVIRTAALAPQEDRA